MAYKSDELLIASMAHTWSNSSNPAAGTTCVAQSTTPKDPTGRCNMSAMNISVRNVSGASVTVTASIRDTSIAGTVLSAFDFIVGNNASTAQSFFLGLVSNPTLGAPLVAEFGTPVASVTQKITISGWNEFKR